MKKWETLLGVEFEDLILIGMVKRGSRYLGRYKCKCGNERIIQVYDVTSGAQKSCGCKRAQNISLGKVKHGGSRAKFSEESSEYISWRAMKARCLNPNDKSYKNYGARKIKIAKRWSDSFDNFLSDMGHKPDPTYTIERINNDWGYTPSNCKWATKQEQANNTRRQSSDRLSSKH